MTLLAGAFALEASAAVLFADNFNNGVANEGWGNESGAWREVDGRYDAGTPIRGATYTSVTSLPGLIDFTVDVDVQDLNDGGVWLRSGRSGGGAISGILLVTGGESGSFDGLYWHVVTDSAFSGQLGRVAVAGLQGDDVHLRIDVLGSTYRAYLDDVLITSLTDGTYGAGRVALYDFSPIDGATDPRRQTFDNLVISVPDRIPEPGSLALLGAAMLGLWRVRRR